MAMQEMKDRAQKVDSSAKKKKKGSYCFVPKCFSSSIHYDDDDNDDDLRYSLPTKVKVSEGPKSVGGGRSWWIKLGLKNPGGIKTVPMVGNPRIHEKHSKFDASEMIIVLETKAEEKHLKLEKGGHKKKPPREKPPPPPLPLPPPPPPTTTKEQRKLQGKTLPTILEEETRDQRKSSDVSNPRETSHNKMKPSSSHKSLDQHLHIGSPPKSSRDTNPDTIPSSARNPSSSKGRQRDRHGDRSTRKSTERISRQGDAIVGMSIIMITLVITLLWGKLCAILCTSAWLYFIPYLLAITKPNHQKIETTTNDLNLNYSQDYKKVILDGLLRREHQKSNKRSIEKHR